MEQLLISNIIKSASSQCIPLYQTRLDFHFICCVKLDVVVASFAQIWVNLTLTNFAPFLWMQICHSWKSETQTLSPKAFDETVALFVSEISASGFL